MTMINNGFIVWAIPTINCRPKHAQNCIRNRHHSKFKKFGIEWLILIDFSIWVVTTLYDISSQNGPFLIITSFVTDQKRRHHLICWYDFKMTRSLKRCIHFSRSNVIREIKFAGIFHKPSISG